MLFTIKLHPFPVSLLPAQVLRNVHWLTEKRRQSEVSHQAELLKQWGMLFCIELDLVPGSLRSE
jgi:hypothetical protein